MFLDFGFSIRFQVDNPIPFERGRQFYWGWLSLFGGTIISNILGFLYNVFRLWPLDQVSGWQATQEWVSYLSGGVSLPKSTHDTRSVSQRGVLVIVTWINERTSMISLRTIWEARSSFQFYKILVYSSFTATLLIPGQTGRWKTTVWSQIMCMDTSR